MIDRLHFPHQPPTRRPCFDGTYYARISRVEIRGWTKRKTPIYDVRLNADFPFCFHASDGRTYRPVMRFDSDGGSIPFFAQGWRVPWINLQRDTFLPQYFLHDNACDMHGLYFWAGGCWEFCKMSREQVDWLLYDSLGAVPTERYPQTANAGERAIIYAAVRAYARAKVRW